MEAVPEHYLVKEVLHSCQGIGGRFVLSDDSYGGDRKRSAHKAPLSTCLFFCCRYIWLQGNTDAGSAFSCGPGAEIPHTQQQLISKITELGEDAAAPASALSLSIYGCHAGTMQHSAAQSGLQAVVPPPPFQGAVAKSGCTVTHFCVSAHTPTLSALAFICRLAAAQDQ